MDKEVKYECMNCFQEEAIAQEVVWAKDKDGEEVLILCYECKNCGNEWSE